MTKINEKSRFRKYWASAPSLMATTDDAKHPRKAQYQAVLKWEYGPMGLILHGSTGTGKSRAMYMLGEHCAGNGYSVRAVDGGDLRLDILDCISPPRRGNLKALRNQLVEPDLLLVDDFDKIKFSEGVFDELFYVFNQRTNYELPTIFTMNSTGEELAAKMAANGATDVEPFIRRMREFLEPIDFDEILPDPPADEFDDKSSSTPPPGQRAPADADEQAAA